LSAGTLYTCFTSEEELLGVLADEVF